MIGTNLRTRPQIFPIVPLGSKAASVVSIGTNPIVVFQQVVGVHNRTNSGFKLGFVLLGDVDESKPVHGSCWVNLYGLVVPITRNVRSGGITHRNQTIRRNHCRRCNSGGCERTSKRFVQEQRTHLAVLVVHGATVIHIRNISTRMTKEIVCEDGGLYGFSGHGIDVGGWKDCSPDRDIRINVCLDGHHVHLSFREGQFCKRFHIINSLFHIVDVRHCVTANIVLVYHNISCALRVRRNNQCGKSH